MVKTQGHAEFADHNHDLITIDHRDHFFFLPRYLLAGDIPITSTQFSGTGFLERGSIRQYRFDIFKRNKRFIFLYLKAQSMLLDAKPTQLCTAPTSLGCRVITAQVGQAIASTLAPLPFKLPGQSQSARATAVGTRLSGSCARALRNQSLLGTVLGQSSRSRADRAPSCCERLLSTLCARSHANDHLAPPRRSSFRHTLSSHYPVHLRAPREHGHRDPSCPRRDGALRIRQRRLGRFLFPAARSRVKITLDIVKSYTSVYSPLEPPLGEDLSDGRCYAFVVREEVLLGAASRGPSAA
ncbi:hypothetical protein DFH06DRAFT_1468080 [Mycena polygramma]|nr:hypothetical protein DFH06DRAFT_1468080 [Mycena polygramma]